MALDMIHSLIVDIPDGMVNRHEVMEKVDYELHKPLGDESSPEVREYVRDRWGTNGEAIAAAEHWDALESEGMIPTYGEDPR